MPICDLCTPIDVRNISDSHKNRAKKVTHTIAGFLDTVRLQLREGFVSKVWHAAENTEIVVFMLSTSESFGIRAIVKDLPERSIHRPCIKLCGGETGGQQLHEGKDIDNIVHVGRLKALNHSLAKDKRPYRGGIWGPGLDIRQQEHSMDHAEHKHTIVDSDYKDLHSRYLQMDESIRNAKLDNLQLMHNILQINYQTTLQHLQKYKQAQVEELKLQRTLLDDHHLNHKALQTEHQIPLQKLSKQNGLMGDRETEDGSDSDTGSQSQSIASTDTRQSLKKAEIQWTEKGELQ
ncbi:hypothetical protein C8J57DRAFT_1252518 [Mycena rebaudengoi]|nr:hypothetical protein C8J57DRAFT_1252518 [Mycena rebaudengoi]